MTDERTLVKVAFLRNAERPDLTDRVECFFFAECTEGSSKADRRLSFQLGLVLTVSIDDVLPAVFWRV